MRIERFQTPVELFNEYQEALINLENIFYEEQGFYPLPFTKKFWDNRTVQKVETLLLLWNDIKEINNPYNQNGGCNETY